MTAKQYFIFEYDLSGDVFSNAVVKLLDLSGKVVFVQSLEQVKNQILIETQNLKSGTYNFYLILDGSVKDNTKIMVVR